MASLNLSTNGPSIKSSYQSVVNATLPASASPTYGHWALFSVQAPLVNAFQNTGGAKESVLKVESTGEGELIDLIEDFSEGRIQFAYVKVKDPNSGLPKNVLIAWCGGGVPERTKGYFTSHLSAVSKILHGYHVQITARSDSDVAPEVIIQKVADASGANYSGSSSAPAPIPRPAPVGTKPVFTPTTSSAGRINPIVAARNRKQDEDGDGWGADAPQISRTQLEKVESAYKPTKVNMAELTGQKNTEPSSYSAPAARNPDVVGGGYQPVGKVDISAIRAAAKNKEDLRPTPVSGAYQPVGKVDIAAIRARAQPQKEEEASEAPRPISDRSAAFSQPQQSERLTSLPKPKVANRFGASTSTFAGTKPPAPGGLGFNKPAAPAPPVVGAASRTFADQGGKTPAQIWAEKKAKKDGVSSTNTITPPMASPIGSQKSGNEWKSGYTGKTWAPVQSAGYGRELSDQETGGSEQNREAQEQEPPSPAGGVASLKDRFKDTTPIAPSPHAPPPVPSAGDRDEQAPPSLPTSTRPQGGFALPGLPSRPPPVEEPEHEETRERSPSPPRIAVPVARSPSPPPAPARELPVRPKEEPARPEPVQESQSSAAPVVAAGVGAAVGVAAGVAAASAYDTEEPAEVPAASAPGASAVALYDYEKAEDNEIDLREDEHVVDIEMVDDDWWVGTNSQGDRGLFPSNYVQIVGDEQQVEEEEPIPAPAPAPEAHQAEAAEPSGGHTATALFDYEAAEDNELSFREGDIITNLDFPDEDWWLGHLGPNQGLFPANYVELNQ
ncbi:related to Drebrin F [Cephalotrichum gorgonifer]|uniref:Related to Drebrin F n=1 Tax=Cephalotrichum gorgonifer TaxID=2041049 RepID=A0AAE8SUH7_9PEZI|nr:related to Drebrin F [Cephalotrichum gorgonifer]